MKWIKLVDTENIYLKRGTLLKFEASYPFESQVIMMVCEGHSINTFGLITITGFKAGINMYVQFPKEYTENGVMKDWLVNNWNYWVYPDSEVNNVLLHYPLNADDI